ncbi:MAG: hypothetical protein NTY64_03775 [Deltaproteobacteria bacterium]|nr:hypothetical protein [Deltaproteobacteria bacterium]
MASQKVHLRRCAAPLVIAAYNLSTPHSSGFARLASEAFYFAIRFNDFLRDHQGFKEQGYRKYFQMAQPIHDPTDPMTE